MFFPKSLSIVLFFFCVILSIPFNIINAQTGPGGVGANDGTSDLIIWYRPDNGIVTSGTSINSWANSAGISAFNLSESGSVRPTLVSNAINGYDEISFNGANRLRTGFTLTTSNFITNQATSVVVAKADNTSQTSSLYTTDPLVSSTRFSTHIPWNGTVYFDIGTCCNSTARLEVGGLSGLNDYSIWSYNANPTTGKQLYRNSDLLQDRAGSSNYTSHASQRFNIGGYTSGTNGYVGDLTELVVFKSTINTAQRIIIDNYLAAKYDRALSSNDIYTHDNSSNGNFDHDVAGIGQASDGTNHTDSRGTGIVRVSNPNNLSDNEFLFWGEETRDPVYNFSANTSTHTEQLSSRWRVRKQGNIGRVDISFDISGLDLTGKQNCIPLQLVLDNNYDFSSPEADDVYDLTIVGTTAIATNVRLKQNRYFTLRYTDQIVWDGTSFSNGSGTANAPDNTNACLKLTVKSGNEAVLTANAHVREVEVESGATLKVSDGFLLEVENGIINNGTIDLLGEAQLIQNHTGTTSNSGSGSLKIRQQGTSNLYNYNYWSAPVNRGGAWQIGYLEDANGVVNFTGGYNANPATSPITLSNYWLYDYNAVSGEYSGWNFLTPSTGLTPGRGYSMKGSGASGSEQEYVFKGEANDGDYSYPVVAGNDFLLGNPYTSALNADQFINDNLSIIEGTLYFWEHFTTNSSHVYANYEGGYATYNLMLGLPAVAGLASNNGTASKPKPTADIAVGQAFFVTMKNAGILVFNNQQRSFAKESLNESVFYKTSNTNTTSTIDDRTKFWFSYTSPSQYKRVIGLGYDLDNATYNFDNGYDAQAYDDQPNELYWVQEDYKLAIQALSEVNTQDELPLGVKVTDVGLFTFSISEMVNVPSGLSVYIKDNMLNTYHNLMESDFVIHLDAGVNEERFSVVFQDGNTLSVEEEALNGISIIYDGASKYIKIRNTENTQLKELFVFNTLGQQVLTQKKEVLTETNMSPFSDGLYIVKIITDKGTKTVKFIKH
ncbi:T9SS type A sorting domain-containing protein [uncultured Lacinutrix sp.]|uniref:T9SS type A sorting domain-containing protein n=1 Tax=uncultured Lacinutrix sp. TaxID=574032 RepID=UPI002632FF34|nr:T9SS type A sorting domain-containing protein [uncultured Lacinutrix sp.]